MYYKLHIAEQIVQKQKNAVVLTVSQTFQVILQQHITVHTT